MPKSKRGARPLEPKRSGTRPAVRIALVVDDDPACAATIALVLGEAGYDVHRASEGGEALAILTAGLRPALITLDLAMPGLDGYDVLDRMLATPELAAIPVLVVSGSLHGDGPPRGAWGAVSKPVEPDALLAAVAACARGRDKTA